MRSIKNCDLPVAKTDRFKAYYSIDVCVYIKADY